MPEPLITPRTGIADQQGTVERKPLTNDDKVLRVQRNVPSLARSKARCYLELNDWDLEQAVRDAKRDTN